MDENLILEFSTKSNSNYWIYRYKIDSNFYIYVLKSDSIAFATADFIILNKIKIANKFEFIGTIYANAIIKKIKKLFRKPYYLVTQKEPDMGVCTVDMKNSQTTTKINDLKIYERQILLDMVYNKILMIDEKYL